MSKPTDPSTALAVSSPMPSGLMALEPRNISEGMQLAAVAAKTKLFGVTSPDDAFVRMATGMGLGLSAWQSLRGLFVISGKVGLAADLMLALCISSPDCEYFRCTETTAERATFTAKRRGNDPMTLSFTMAEARTAGLTGNSMYTKYPANMLRARAIAFLARLMFPERMHGILTREEIDGIEAERAQSAGDARAITVDPLAATSDHIARSFAAGKCPLCDGAMGPGMCERVGPELVCRGSQAPALPDVNDRADAFEARIREASTLEELARVATDIGRDPHERMRADMLGMAEARRVEMAGKLGDTAGAV